jgi:hypothetical protein
LSLPMIGSKKEKILPSFPWLTSVEISVLSSRACCPCGVALLPRNELVTEELIGVHSRELAVKFVLPAARFVIQSIKFQHQAGKSINSNIKSIMATEADTCRKFVVSKKLQAAGWDSDPHSIAEQHSFTDGWIVLRDLLLPRLLSGKVELKTN